MEEAEEAGFFTQSAGERCRQVRMAFKGRGLTRVDFGPWLPNEVPVNEALRDGGFILREVRSEWRKQEAQWVVRHVLLQVGTGLSSVVSGARETAVAEHVEDGGGELLECGAFALGVKTVFCGMAELEAKQAWRTDIEKKAFLLR